MGGLSSSLGSIFSFLFTLCNDVNMLTHQGGSHTHNRKYIRVFFFSFFFFFCYAQSQWEDGVGTGYLRVHCLYSPLFSTIQFDITYFNFSNQDPLSYPPPPHMQYKSRRYRPLDFIKAGHTLSPFTASVKFSSHHHRSHSPHTHTHVGISNLLIGQISSPRGDAKTGANAGSSEGPQRRRWRRCKFTFTCSFGRTYK